jgi:fatty acid desaturase
VILPQLLQGKLSWPSKEDVPEEWTINGKKYNLKPFYDSHPGGSFALRAARGSDCTGLFESYHIFIDREVLLRMLARYEIKDAPPAEKPAMVYNDDFYNDLKQAVRDHFKGKGKGAHKMTWAHLGLCFLAWAGMWFCIYNLLTNDSLWCIPAIGFLSWYLTGNVMHDASHTALVTQPWANRLLSRAAFPYGVNVPGWQIQHVMSHHIYTNEENDVDLYHFDPIVALEKGVGTVNILLHMVRLTYLLSSAIPHLALVVPYGLLFGQIDPAHGHRMYDRVKAIKAHRAELKWELVLETVALFAFYALCYSYHGFVKAISYQMSVYVISSYLFSFFTQVSHLQEECFVDPKKRDELSFAKRQVSSSMDFAADSAFWGHVSGGLNTQAIHHCFPSVSAMHLRDMYPKFRQVCKKHGVHLKEQPSLGAFVWGFVQFAN